MKKVIIFGGTGFIGTSVAKYLSSKGFYPIVIGRTKTNESLEFVKWDGMNAGEWEGELNNAFAIINLVGKSVDCIKTPKNIDEILKSRVDATLLIGKALRKANSPPKIWIQMSTAHIYGDSETRINHEDSTLGYGLAPFVGKKWEAAFHASALSDTRKVLLRTGFVLDKSGGAFTKLKQIVSLGLGGKVANGKQGMSWIHMEDLNRFAQKALLDKNIQGIYNLSAPKPVNNAVFMCALRKHLEMPIGLSTPLLMLKLGAKLFFKTDYELLVYGRFVVSKRLESVKFNFKYPDLDSALKNLI